MAKVYTATLIMRLAESGELDLDTPVADLLPEFSVADPDATRAITTRLLLSHTSGLTCNFTYDSGRGDDCLARYVEAARNVALDCPPGTGLSYSSLGYNVLGRIIEVVTGKVWDEALRDLLLTPLGLTHTMARTDASRRRRGGGRHPRPVQGDRRLDAAAGGRLPRQVDGQRGWLGAGWTLYDWDGVQGFGHDGASIGQYGYLRVVPSAGVAVVLLTNGGGSRELYAAL
ncbi:serine hydrolase domain-containing protein [Streptomyces rubiginosohelvolus]|uniref:serine hydrolase domain-containing protein n=1 Tax=Streptomyces rubiginosohelvolus TaxID=67362 RepID=UPI0036A3D357